MADTRKESHPKRGAGSADAGRRRRGDVRAQILKVATRIFAARGFDGTTLQAVAEEVGIRKPSVLHHFPSKEALRAGVIDDVVQHWNRLVPQIMRSATSGANRFDFFMRELVGFFAADPDCARLFARESLDRPKELRAVFLEHVRPWLAMIGEGIREGQRRGTYRGDLDPEVYTARILQFIVIVMATGDLLTIPEEGGARAREPQEVRELLRIARASLFKDDPAPAPASASPVRKGRK